MSVPIETKCTREVQILRELGAIQSGPLADSITCRACHSDHAAEIEFDATARRYFHFCPEAGIVKIDDADLATYQHRPEWLVDWLATALQVPSRLRQRALVPDRAWHLGDARCGDTQITVVFACRVCSQADLDRLASALHPIHPAEKGLVITTSLQVARQVRLPGGYELLPLPEIVRATSDGLVLDSQRLGFWIRGMRPTTAKGGPSRTGRPSPESVIRQMYDRRRSCGLVVGTISGEAKAILAEWKEYAPDQTPPNHSTVRRHVASFAKSAART